MKGFAWWLVFYLPWLIVVGLTTPRLGVVIVGSLLIGGLAGALSEAIQGLLR